MKKLLILSIPALLVGCSYYHSTVERVRVHTDTLEYSCDERPLTVELNQDKQIVNFTLNNKALSLKQGLSASGARYTDGVYVFWSKGDDATVYHQDEIVLHNCQLQNPKR